MGFFRSLGKGLKGLTGLAGSILPGPAGMAAKLASNAIGTHGGGGGGGFNSQMFGQQPGIQQAELYSPEQKTAMGQLLRQGMSQASFAPQEALARQGFARQTMPTIMERFRSMGTGQDMASSGLGSAVGQAGMGLEAQLAGQRSQQGMQMMQMGLGRQSEPYWHPGQRGMADEFKDAYGDKLLPFAGKAFGQLGSSLKGMFSHSPKQEGQETPAWSPFNIGAQGGGGFNVGGQQQPWSMGNIGQPWSM